MYWIIENQLAVKWFWGFAHRLKKMQRFGKKKGVARKKGIKLSCWNDKGVARNKTIVSKDGVITHNI